MSPQSAPSKFTVAILPLGSISSWQIELTAGVLEQEFGVNTLVLPAMEIPAQCFNAQRGQYQVDPLLNFLFFQLPVNAQRMVGIIEGALEYSENKPCFGYADFKHRVAIYSVPHLGGQSDNHLDNDLESYHLVAHEFGHTLGIAHCAKHDCIMHSRDFSTTMCARCRRWANRELKVQPGSAEERFSLAESYLLHNCLPQAIALYREAIALAPREPLYYHGLSMALYSLKQSEEAKKNLVLALAHSSDYPGFYYTCGMACLRNDLKQAEEFFEKALAATEHSKKLHRLIGQAYREILHDVEKASRHYKEYLRLGGNDQDVVDWLISRSRMDPT